MTTPVPVSACREVLSTVHPTSPQNLAAGAPDPMRPRRVLIFPAGTEIGMEIFSALRWCRGIQLFAAGEDVSSHARLLYPEYHAVPSVHAEGWQDTLASLCRKLGIDCVFPAHDDVLLALSQSRENLPADVVAPSKEVCQITRSKSATYRRLADVVAVPRLHSSPEAVTAFPVFVKPDRGQGSLNAVRADNAQQLHHALSVTEDPLICEYLPGEEFTIDCFSSRREGLLFCHARCRTRVRNGISNNTVTVDLPEARTMAMAIANRLPMRGAWFFQARRAESGTLTLLEVAPRIAGAMAAHRVMGVNFPLLSLMERDDIALQVQPNPGNIELDRCLRNRYRHDIRFDTLYIDLDDTLIFNGSVNTDAIKLVFQCINAGKRVVLLTRHAADIGAMLHQHRLNGLFDEIVHVRDGSPKSGHIRGDRPILVDDSFAERHEVHDTLGIPTFDMSMIEMLTEQAISTATSSPTNLQAMLR